MEEFCFENHLPVLLRIPFERVIAEGVAQGKTLVEIHPEYADRFLRLFTQISAMS
jgi:MinD superfamily P-loop ATPase